VVVEGCADLVDLAKWMRIGVSGGWLVGAIEEGNSVVSGCASTPAFGRVEPTHRAKRRDGWGTRLVIQLDGWATRHSNGRYHLGMYTTPGTVAYERNGTYRFEKFLLQNRVSEQFL
jgi:hypothetical protein